ncbi:MAG: carbonic anhydrase family protein [Planctomycetota bacterium]
MSNIIYPSQSPIDLGKAQPINFPFAEEYLKLHWEAQECGKQTGIGDLCEIVFENSKNSLDITLPGADKPTNFDLIKYHIHSQSEHLIDGYANPIEMHIVHEAKEVDPYNIGKFRTIYAVVAIFIDIDSRKTESDPTDSFIKGLIQNKLRSFSESEFEILNPEPIAPSNFLPEKPHEFWRYEGSLTTNRSAPNPQYVSWIVLKNPKLMPQQTVKDFIDSWRHEPKEIQPLDRRFVFYNSSKH